MTSWRSPEIARLALALLGALAWCVVLAVIVG